MATKQTRLTPFGRKVRKRLIDKNMTQVELAALLGCNKQYIHMFWIGNDFMVPLIMMNNERLMTIQLSISRLFGQYASKWDIALPALVMTILPIVIVFILLQKKIMDGVIAGAVKG